MTNDIAKLKALLAKATPGPWLVGTSQIIGTTTDHGKNVPVENSICQVWDSRTPQGIANSELIPALRNAMPSLLARLEAAEKVCEAADKSLRGRTASMMSCDQIDLGTALAAHRAAKEGK